MYSFSDEKNDYHIKLICDCGRKFKLEEIYICYNCNKFLCRFCLNEKIEYCFCKNYCKRNQSISVNQAKKFRGTCDQCLDCPHCDIPLIKKYSNGKYFYYCTFCYWDSITLRFHCSKEEELNNLIFQYKESSIKGFLNKVYDQTMNKLKIREGIKDSTTLRESLTRSYLTSDLATSLKYASSVNSIWDLKDLKEKLNEEEKTFNEKNEIKYDDNYISDKTMFPFPAIINILSTNFDYLDKHRIETYDDMVKKLKNEYDASFVSGLDQRLNHVVGQHPQEHTYFPKFTDLIPRMSKRCKQCKKYIVQTEEIGKKSQKLEVCHVYLKQFPMIYIHEIDKENSLILLRFIMLDFKETKLKFSNDPDSHVTIDIPHGEYSLTDSLSSTNDTNDDYVYSKGERFVILKFYYNAPEGANEVIFSCGVSAEYHRVETKKIDFRLEIKFKV